MAFDELTSLPPSFSGQSSLSDDFMVVPAAAIAKDAKVGCPHFVKSYNFELGSNDFQKVHA